MKISRYYRKFLRIKLNVKNKERLKNRDFTILCNNCVGGVILHELGQRLNTPTVNLFFDSEDYIKFLENLDYYLQHELVETRSVKDYPVGKIDDILIHFLHYSTFDEAKIFWEKRKARIKKDNLYVIMVQQNGCTKEIIQRFDHLPYEHKLALVTKPMPEINCAYYISGTEQSDGNVMDLCQYKGKFTGKRWIDDYDYVGFLNR